MVFNEDQYAWEAESKTQMGYHTTDNMGLIFQAEVSRRDKKPLSVAGPQATIS